MRHVKKFAGSPRNWTRGFLKSFFCDKIVTGPAVNFLKISAGTGVGHNPRACP